jgi:uncharacterized membrane protein YphA (DoxX/SURF4 family)
MLVLLGLLTRLAAVPLLIVICTAIVSTKDSGIVSRQPGILVHGERCANGFRDAVLAVVSDFGGRGKMVSGLAMATKTGAGRSAMTGRR